MDNYQTIKMFCAVLADNFARGLFCAGVKRTSSAPVGTRTGYLGDFVQEVKLFGIYNKLKFIKLKT
ncbi:hypothetical protein HQ571_04065 [Candidatus Kuenenbacteria bacterium]|nr:hypothetical protein [Candidatus Kuenenbacteria bacterium]